IGKNAIDKYVAKDCEWIDGKRADALFVPHRDISESLPPVIVEIQNIVDKEFMHRLSKYCHHIYDNYHQEPVALVICINNTQVELCKKFTDTQKGLFLKKLPSDFWAKDCFIMTPSTVKQYYDHQNDDDNHLPPLLALGYVLMEEKCSVLGLQYKDDPTVMMLYATAKKVLNHQIQNHKSIVDILIQTNTVTNRKFKRIIEECDEDENNESMKRIKSLASAGSLFTETCLHKYSYEDNTNLSTSSTPPSLPENSQDVLSPSSPKSRLDDMKFAAAFKDEYMNTHKRMNWAACYQAGVSKGYFGSYKNSKNLKNTFNEVHGSAKTK
ncbi:hypothetical protein BDC45DRAFT_440047, partial [Circinella umbellata]